MRLIKALTLGAYLCAAAAAFAQDLTFSAKVDKTSIKLGEPIQLTISLGGDITGIELPDFQFPEGFAVAARSQATNFTIRAGATERSASVTYVLVPQQAGTFTVGPFHLEHQGRQIQTEPITITVEKSALPPFLKPQGPRYTL